MASISAREAAVYDRQIRGKDDIIEFQMPTNTAHPYALYLQMLFSNLSLRGKLNFASLAHIQMVQESLESPAANATASFYDHYDMTKFNFLSHVGWFLPSALMGNHHAYR